MSVFSLKKHLSLSVTDFNSPSSFAIMDLLSLQPIPQMIIESQRCDVNSAIQGEDVF